MSFPLPLTSKIKKLIQKADHFRDQRNWDQAIQHYTMALDAPISKKKRFSILKQLGNCQRENRLLEASLKTYTEAEKLFPEDSDLHVQLGRSYYAAGKTGRSAFSYRRALDLNSHNEDAKFEINQSGDFYTGSNANRSLLPLHNEKREVRTIWLDMTDLLEYANANISLSGIQRVVANLVLYIQKANLPGYRIVPVIPDYHQHTIFSIRMSSLLELIKAYDALHVSSEAIRNALDDINHSRSKISPEKDDVLIVAGAFWIYPHYDTIMYLRRKGLRFGLFLHDLIQIRMPEYVERAVHDQFIYQFSDALDVTDFILTNSEYVAQDVRDFISEKKNYSLPVEAIVLPTELRSHSQFVEITNTNIRDLANIDYVLCVSTIEIRKNHTLLIRVWEKLHEELGDKTPALVFVGKWGWEIAQLRRYVEEMDYIGDWLFIFNGISDTEMEYLYKNSLFSIYPSFAEGFGLPIGESLVYGKPCIASSTTSMPEVGGKFVKYIDPLDWKKSYPIIRDTIVNREELTRWQEWIEKDFVPKTWHTFSEEFYDAVLKHAKQFLGTPPHLGCYLPACQFILGGAHDILRGTHLDGKVITFRTARHHNWHPSQHWGVWSRKRHCEIQFVSEYREGDKVIVFLRLQTHLYHDVGPVAVINAGDGEQSFRLSPHPTLYKVPGIVGKNGIIHVSLNAHGKFVSSDEFFGWSGIAYCPADNIDLLLKTYDSIIQTGRPFSELPLMTSQNVSLPH